MMRTVFLCAPYTTKIGCIKDIKLNIQIAIKASQYLRKNGFNVFCPHVAIAGYCGDLDDTNKEDHSKIMEMCLQWVDICEYFATIPGWEKSKNCRAEYAYAEGEGKQIIHLTYGMIGV